MVVCLRRCAFGLINCDYRRCLRAKTKGTNIRRVVQGWVKYKIKSIKVTVQSGKLTVELPEEPSLSDSDEPWKRFLIPHPRFPRQHFFNSILPQVYESAQPHLLGQFESYWIKEKRDRWERKQLLESFTASVTRITELSDNNYIA